MKKKTEKIIKKGLKNPLIACAVIFLLLGVALGIVVYNFVNKDGFTKLELNGEKIVSIDVGTTYEELGATVIINDKDYSNKVIVKGSVDTSKAGTYIITYELDDNGNKVVLTRVVNVLGGVDNE